MLRFFSIFIAAVVGTGLFVPPSVAEVKSSGYVLDICIPEEGEYLSDESKKTTVFNMCSKKAYSIYDKVLKTSKVNFNKDYVLIEVKYPIKDLNTGKVQNFTLFNYVAINPKTKKGYTLPFVVYHDDGSKNSPKLKFNVKSGEVCTTQEGINFTNEGTRTSFTSYKDEPICVKLDTSGGTPQWHYFLEKR